MTMISRLEIITTSIKAKMTSMMMVSLSWVMGPSCVLTPL